ncbi:hypothetical protein [Arthrobacter dokdonensis]|uniref:hypothetical protein n=1 Tax=Arthrobacter dokdonellae TaxID=2211210 RepID=UPI001013C94E|nr:hypothetical protein [Arthrobacter dokdonellae]
MTAALALAAGLAVTAATPPPSSAPSASPPPAAATQAPPAAATTAPATPSPVATASTSPAATAPATTAPAAPAPATTAPAAPTPAPKVGTPAPKVTPTTVAPTPKPTGVTAKAIVKAAPKAAAKVTPKAAAALVCKPATAQPTNSFPGTTVVADNFESGNLSKWAVHTGGTGTAAVVSNAWVTGACSTHLHATTASGSIATLTKAIPAGLGEVYADGYFDVQTAAPAGAANSYLRFYIGSTRIASIYRNTSGGQLWLNTLNSTGSSALFRLTSAAVTTGRWHQLQVHLLPNGTTSVLQIWLDGTMIYHTNNLDGRTGAISSVATGNEFAGQQGDLYLDNLIIKAKAQPSTALVCKPATAQPSNSFPGTTVVADNFESGNLNNWAVKTGGDGTAAVVSNAWVTGACSTHLHATTASGSIATLTKAIPAGLGEVYADGYFDVQTAAPAGAANSYLRFYIGSTRIASIYRNTSGGQLWLNTLNSTGSSALFRLTSAAVTTGRWHQLQVHLLPNGTTSVLQIWLDGTMIYHTNNLDGRTGAISSVATGNEFAGQQGDLYLDNLIIKAQSNVDCNTEVPTDTFPGTTVVADGFECGNLNKWTLQKGGDATATVQQTTVHTGLNAASLVTSTNNLSRANLSHSIPAGSTDVYMDGWFDITAIGPVGNDVPYFRFWTGSTRFADIYRYNSTGQLWLRVLTPTGTDAYTQLSKTAVSLSAWHHVQMRVAANGVATTIQVWFDGVQVYNSAAVNTSATSTTLVMLGSEHYPQPASINIDDVIVKSVP